MPVHHDIFEHKEAANRIQQAFQGSLDAHQLCIERHCLLGFVLAALGSAALPLFGCLGWRFFRFLAGFAGFFFFCAAHDLGHLQRVRTLSFHIHQRKGEKCQTRYHPLLDTGEEPIQPVRCFPGFAGDNFIAADKVLSSFLEKLQANK